LNLKVNVDWYSRKRLEVALGGHLDSIFTASLVYPGFAGRNKNVLMYVFVSQFKTDGI